MSQASTVPLRKVVIRNPLDVPIAAIANRFGDRSKDVERFLKFAIVGALGAVIDFTTLIVLQATILPPIEPNKNLKISLAITIAFVAAVLSNFIWNRFWTYPDSRSRSLRRQLVQFAGISFVGWFVRTLWVNAAFQPLGALLMPLLLPEIQLFRPGYVPSASAQDKVGTMAALLIGVVIVMVWNFLANRYWTYSDVK